MNATMVKYRSIAGDVYDASLLAIEGERATIDILSPGPSRRPWLRGRVPYLAVDNGQRGVCFVAPAAVIAPLSRQARRAARVAEKEKPSV